MLDLKLLSLNFRLLCSVHVCVLIYMIHIYKHTGIFIHMNCVYYFYGLWYFIEHLLGNMLGFFAFP